MVTCLYARNSVNKMTSVKDFHILWNGGGVALNINTVGWQGFSPTIPSITMNARVEQKVKNDSQQFQIVWSGVLMYIYIYIHRGD